MGNGSSSQCSYKPPPKEDIDDSPPTKPEDTQKAFYTLIKSGEHYRADLRCAYPSAKDKVQSSWFSADVSAADQKCFDLTGPELKEKYGADIDDSYRKWQETLEMKHLREARVVYDKYTGNLQPAIQKFKNASEEPICQQLQKDLYMCYRKNPDKTLRCYDEAVSYMNCVTQNASKCYRLGSKAKRIQAQAPCKADIEPVRTTPNGQAAPATEEKTA